jgi:hypothetical protein
MTVRRLASVLAALAWVLAAHGCGIQPAEVPDAMPRVCDPGTVFSCYLPGCQAHQSCNIDGSELSECTCNVGDGTGAGIEEDDGGSGR